MNMIASYVRNRFFAGVLVVVPIIATFIALRFLFVQIDGLFAPWISELIGRHIPGLGVVVTAVVVLIAGIVASNFLGRRLVRFTDGILGKVPLVRSIHKASKDIVQTATLSRRQVFRDVVMVEYPRRGMHSYGFVTSYATRHGPEGAVEVANVFIPGPPVPTTGALVVLPLKDLFYLDVSVEEALKLVLSGGMVSPRDLRERPSAGSGVEGDPDWTD
ncbi:MAG: DUF502 domain-containing protein [Candidatus Krumholzibacteria bacterium]|nr:DUF502 domain-containing protein [Candidatus Krumholzibacteria bacterium]